MLMRLMKGLVATAGVILMVASCSKNSAPETTSPQTGTVTRPDTNASVTRTDTPPGPPSETQQGNIARPDTSSSVRPDTPTRPPTTPTDSVKPDSTLSPGSTR